MKASLRISSSSSSKHAPSLLPLFLICTGSCACLTQSREMWNMERMREQQHSHFSGQGLLKEWKIPAELYGSVPYLSSHPQTAAAAAHVWEIAFIFVLVSSTCLVPHFSALIILISIFFFHWFPDWFFFYIYDYCSALMVSLDLWWPLLFFHCSHLELHISFCFLPINSIFYLSLSYSQNVSDFIDFMCQIFILFLLGHRRKSKVDKSTAWFLLCKNKCITKIIIIINDQIRK